MAKGFRQIAGFDFTKNFSPVVKPTYVRVILTAALSIVWNIVRQLDINNSFFNRNLNKEMYMTQPQGFEDPSISGDKFADFTSLYMGSNKLLEIGLRSCNRLYSTLNSRPLSPISPYFTTLFSSNNHVLVYV